MSRQIPLDRALSDEDRRYLRQRGSVGLDLERRIDEQFPPDPAHLKEFNARERLEYAKIHAKGNNALEEALARNAQLEAELAALRAAQASSSPKQPVVYDENEWSKSALESEIDRVNKEDPDAKLAKGTKAEMVAALNRYFANESED